MSNSAHAPEVGRRRPVGEERLVGRSPKIGDQLQLAARVVRWRDGLSADRVYNPGDKQFPAQNSTTAVE